MRFQHLSDVHTRRHAERIEHDINRGAVFIVRHVFHRYDHGNDALVTVTARHLVTRLYATLDGHVDLDHLQHAGRQIVTRGNLVTLLFQTLVKILAQLFQLPGSGFQLLVGLFVFQTDLEPLALVQFIDIGLGDLGTGLEPAGTTVCGLASQQLLDTLEDITFHNAQLIVQILLDSGNLVFFDLQRARILFDTVARKHLYVYNDTVHTGGHPQRGIFYV